MNHLPYERQGYSQNHETGIIEYMLAGVTNPQKTFVEIGFGDGTQNMTLDLLHRGYSGVGIDGWNWAESVTQRWPAQLVKIQQMIAPDTVMEYIPQQFMEPDFFSLDIDSFDYQVAQRMLAAGFRPAVVCCEINCNFGNEWASFPYVNDAIKKTYDRKFHYGCSLPKYQALWSQHGYEFFTLDTRAVNAFWYDPTRTTIDTSVPRYLNQCLDPIDPNVILQRISQHWFWHDKIDEIYQ